MSVWRVSGYVRRDIPETATVSGMAAVCIVMWRFNEMAHGEEISGQITACMGEGARVECHFRPIKDVQRPPAWRKQPPGSAKPVGPPNFHPGATPFASWLLTRYVLQTDKLTNN